MANLLGSLQTAGVNLNAFAQALATVQHNVGNATTPGYARQRIFFKPLPFVVAGGQSGGVAVDRVDTVRDKFLDFQVVAALQGESYFEKLAQALAPLEAHLPLSGDLSIGAATDALFGAFQTLATSPSDFNLRQQVLTAARSLATSVRTAYNGITGQRAGLDFEAVGVIRRINTLAAELVDLNKILMRPGLNADPAAIQTRLTQVLEELGTLVDYRLITQQDGQLAVVLGDGIPLVAGAFSFPLTAFPTGPRLEIRDQQGADISAGIQGGQLGAILNARNVKIPGYLGQLDQFAAAVADAVNGQLAEGRDLSGAAGRPLFQYTSLAFTGSGRTPGASGGATPSPPISIDITFSGGVAGSISASLPSFLVASAPPSGLSNGDTITVNFASADQSIRASITTEPLSAGDSTAVLAARLNDQVALNPQLAGKVTFVDEGGRLKIIESDTVGQGLTFTASTSNPAFSSGLESGGSLGGQSAQEIADALNAQVALNPALAQAGIRFRAAGGEVKVDGNVSFTAAVTDNPRGTGFASGLAGTFTAGGSPAAATFALTDLSNREIAAAGPDAPGGNANALALARLASGSLIGGFTFSEFYARLVAGAGGDLQQAQSRLATERQILLEARNLRDAFSGVSLDEEAARLIEFQKAYEATARVITVLDSLAGEIINLVRP